MTIDGDAFAERALGPIANYLTRRGVPFALVGGLAVSVRTLGRYTRNVDLAVRVVDDAALESLAFDLDGIGYDHVVYAREARGRIATVRLRSPSAVIVILHVASSGIESETIDRATPVRTQSLGIIPVARAEELIAMKLLSMTDRRPKDRNEVINLIHGARDLSLDEVDRNLGLMLARGYGRDQSLHGKLAEIRHFLIGESRQG